MRAVLEHLSSIWAAHSGVYLAFSGVVCALMLLRRHLVHVSGSVPILPLPTSMDAQGRGGKTQCAKCFRQATLEEQAMMVNAEPCAIELSSHRVGLLQSNCPGKVHNRRMPPTRTETPGYGETHHFRRELTVRPSGECSAKNAATASSAAGDDVMSKPRTHAKPLS